MNCYKYGKLPKVLTHQRKILFVPYDENNDAKILGAKFDGHFWYSFIQDKNHQKLLDKFDERLFLFKNKRYVRIYHSIQELNDLELEFEELRNK